MASEETYVGHRDEGDAVTVNNVKAFLLSHDGRVKHSDLINHFRRPLTDPDTKGQSRAEFKDILSKISLFRTENGERYVILSKAYCMRTECHQNAIQSKKTQKSNQKRGMSNGEDYQPSHQINDDTGDIDQEHSFVRNPALGSRVTLSSQSSTSTFDSGIGIDSQPAISSLAGRIRSLSKSNDSLDDELMAEFDQEEGLDDALFNIHNEFSQEEKKWMLYASLCDCQQLAAMMDKNPALPGKRDFITSALHWGAKLGKRDLVRLIADTGVDVNLRTGQTALHLASMHGHDMIIKMLINDYGADVHARDYSGKKPKDLVKDTVAPDIQRKLGRSLILDSAKPIRRYSNVTLSPRLQAKRAAMKAMWRRSQSESNLRNLSE